MNLSKAVAFLLLLVAIAACSAESKPTEDQNAVLEDTRAYALRYVERLPDFICTQITRRDVGVRNFSTGFGGAVMTNIMHESNDIIDEQLTYSGGKESYTVLSLDGKKASGARHTQLAGAISWGEFGSLFSQVFDLASHTVFTWDRVERVQGRQLWAFKYRVPKEFGTTVIDQPTQRTIVVSYSGKVVIDPETKNILEISSALDIPATFPIHNVTRKVVYAYQDIAGKKYCLPLHAEMRMEEAQRVYDNQIDFKDYHHFSSDSTIIFSNGITK